MEFRRLIAYTIIAVFLGSPVLPGCSRERGGQAGGAEAGEDPLEIHLYIDESWGQEHEGALIREGILDAHSRKGTLSGRKVELLSTGPGTGTIDSPEAAAELFLKERITGPALLCSERVWGEQGGSLGAEGMFVTLVTSARCLVDQGKGCAVQIGSSLRDRARTAALFAVNTLGATEAVIVLDEDAPGSIVLASVFSSEMVRMGGAVSDVCIISGKNPDIGGALETARNRNPGVIYVPYSEGTTISALNLLLKEHPGSPVVVVNVPRVNAFLQEGGESLSGVYLVMDSPFPAERPQGILARIREFRDTSESRESLKALGAEAYVRLLDLLEGKELQGNPTEAYGGDLCERGPSGAERLPLGLSRGLRVCRIARGALKGLHLEPVELVDPGQASDLGADVVAQ
ncbi:MAG: hypothetical protein WAR22_13290 [Desulfomonilia bacterium]